MHSVADQLTGDFDFKLRQLALGDGVRLGNDWDDVDLQLRISEILNRGRHNDVVHTMLSEKQ